MTDITENDALSRMAAYCSTAEHCRADVMEKLQRWGVAYDAIGRILDYLEKERYLDDERFCRAFIRDKYRFTKWGRVKIGQALQQKKIPFGTYGYLLNEIDEEEYLSILRDLLATKRKSIRAADEYERNGKLIRFALSRGFEMKDIRCCMDVPDENDFVE